MPPIRDKLYQLAFKIAQSGLIVFAFIFRPATKGVNIAVWQGDRLLIIKNSYYHKYTVPGGYVKPGENPRAAAIRELAEEVGIRVEPDQLKFVQDYRFKSNYKRETVSLFKLQLKTLPQIRIDNREVIWAGFLSPEEALARSLSLPARQYLTSIEKCIPPSL